MQPDRCDLHAHSYVNPEDVVLEEDEAPETETVVAVEPRHSGLLGTVEEWSSAAESGGPWFIIGVLGLVVVLLTKFFIGREKELRSQIEVLNKSAVDREKACHDTTSEALSNQASVFQERYDALRDESREEHRKRNDEIRDVAVTMTQAIANDMAAKQMLAKSVDDMKSEVSRLSTEVRDFAVKKR